jgi:hypothetical protein
MKRGSKGRCHDDSDCQLWAGGTHESRQLISNSTYNPEQLRVIQAAFDSAWARIAPDVSNRPDSIEAACLKLVEAGLAVAKDGFTDPENLKERVLRMMFADPQRL